MLPVQYASAINIGVLDGQYLILLLTEMYVRGSFKRSRNHFICDKYKIVQSFKLHLLQNSPLVQLYISASDYEGVGNIPGSNFMKALSVHPSQLSYVSRITKGPSLHC